MAATRKVKLASGWAYYVQQSDSRWKKVSKAEYDAAQHDHRASPGGAWQRPAGRAAPPVSTRADNGPRSRTTGPVDDEDDDSDSVVDEWGDAFGYPDPYGIEAMGVGADPTPQGEMDIAQALMEKAQRDYAAKQRNDKLQKAAQYAQNPAAAVWDGVKAAAEKVADTTVAKTKQSVVNAETADWLPIIAVVGILILGSKRRR